MLFNRTWSCAYTSWRTSFNNRGLKTIRSALLCRIDYLIKILGIYIIPGILAYGILGMFFLGKVDPKEHGLEYKDRNETFKDVIMRAVKVYVFIAALVLLGDGFKPLIFEYFTQCL